jgi:hypothetical protein
MGLFVELKIVDASDSVTQRILCIHKETPFAPGMIRMMLNLLVAVWAGLASYAAAHSGCQFRVHIFSVLISRKVRDVHSLGLRWCD